MNAIAERWIGGCRRELLDRTLIWNQAHLRRILHDYETHHNQHRPHRSLDGAAPLRQPAKDPDHDQIEEAKRHKPRSCPNMVIRPNCRSQSLRRVLKRYKQSGHRPRHRCRRAGRRLSVAGPGRARVHAPWLITTNCLRPPATSAGPNPKVTKPPGRVRPGSRRRLPGQPTLAMPRAAAGAPDLRPGPVSKRLDGKG
jgi:Integrase core domain